MRLVYHLSSYISHRRAGGDYTDCLRLAGHELSSDLADVAEADAVILHDEPPLFPELFARQPLLAKKRVIAYCVWENEILPEAYAGPLALAEEIWTPSEFSRRALASRFEKVSVVPHIVRRPKASAADMESVGRRLEPARGRRFYCVADAANPRKNIPWLLAVFEAVRRELRLPLSLVLKTYRQAWSGPCPQGVLVLDEPFSDGEMAALHRQCDIYVSAHHAEGWGLGISEAMAFGRPVIATGWSGNMDYMNDDNSFPVPYDMETVSEAMCRALPLFSPQMRWASPRARDFAEVMRRAAFGRIAPDMPRLASDITRRFSPGLVAARLEELLTRGDGQGDIK